MKKIRAAVSGAFAVLLCCIPTRAAVTDAERELLLGLVLSECAGEPLAARVAVVGIVLDRSAAGECCVADAVHTLAAEGEIGGLGMLWGADVSSDERRLAYDAVDAALAGCRPAGVVSSFVRQKKEKPRLDFEDGEPENGVVIGGFVFR